MSKTVIQYSYIIMICIFQKEIFLRNSHYQLFTGEESRIPFIFDDFQFCRSRVIGLDMMENRTCILCRMITWVVFLRMFWNFISSLPVKREVSLSFLVGTISNVFVITLWALLTVILVLCLFVCFCCGSLNVPVSGLTALHRIKYYLNIFQKHLYIDKILYITTVAHGEVYSIQQYVIKFVSDFRQVGGLLPFPPPIKLIATILLKYCWRWR
jgi:hypothetical protein